MICSMVESSPLHTNVVPLIWMLWIPTRQVKGSRIKFSLDVMQRLSLRPGTPCILGHFVTLRRKATTKSISCF